MAVYLHLFETESQFRDKRINDYYEPWVSLTEESNDRVDYNKTEYEKAPETPLTFEITRNGEIHWTSTHTAYTRTIQYKKNDSDWTSITSSTGGTNISVVSGDIVQFKGDNNRYSSGNSSILSDYRRAVFSGTTCGFKLKGNIMSLINSRSFKTLTTLTGELNFYHLFEGCTGLTDASNLVLPATTLRKNCYTGMFLGCTSLVTAPELPATTLVTDCYNSMFYGCTSLTTAPELPATTLADSCYYHMFQGCTSLTTAPSLPATTLAKYCYCYMFQDCTSLTTAPSLPATTLVGYCYGNMFQGCTSLTTAPSLPATTLVGNCYYEMFYGCTGLTTAPELPATTLADHCYYGMFYGCTGLTTAPELPATALADYCYSNMFRGCTNLNYIKAMFTTTPSASYTGNWVNGVASSGTFVKNSAASWNVTGNNGVPTGWTVQTASS